MEANSIEPRLKYQPGDAEPPIDAAEKSIDDVEPDCTGNFNNLLDAAVAGTFLVLVTAIIFVERARVDFAVVAAQTGGAARNRTGLAAGLRPKGSRAEFSHGGRRGGHRARSGEGIVRRIAFRARATNVEGIASSMP